MIKVVSQLSRGKLFLVVTENVKPIVFTIIIKVITVDSSHTQSLNFLLGDTTLPSNKGITEKVKQKNKEDCRIGKRANLFFFANKTSTNGKVVKDINNKKVSIFGKKLV